ncbi:MAG TPA: type VI secretion system protein TssA [Bryobacteraceae bacterium]|nr:type VI secretion system protein TssA [Bryobacteraceae bacterium]
MPEIERFLEPIPGDNPAGVYLRYDPVYSKIEEARRKEDPAVIAKMQLGRDAKIADYKVVTQVGEDALIKRTKDLQIAAWLTEAWTYRERVPGVIAGIKLLKALLDKFWDSVYPEPDEGDLGDRRMPLDWIGSSSDFVSAFRGVPLTKNPKHSWYAYQDARAMGYEKDVAQDKAKKAIRDDAIKQAKVPPEEFDEAFEQTEKPFYKAVTADLQTGKDLINELDDYCNEKFTDDPPSFTLLKKAFDEVANVAQILLLRKLEKDPDPVEVVEAPVVEEAASAEGDGQGAALPAGTMASGQLDLSDLGQIKDPEQAALHVVAAAQFIRQKNPASPVSYLLLRALRWGEVRSVNGSNVPELPAPPSEIRVTLKTSAAGNQWKRVLETAESAMSRTCGRGWLDLQRYTISACDALGYADAAKALRSELRAFLLDFPELPGATLNDDTGTANPETLNWLRKEGLIL